LTYIRLTEEQLGLIELLVKSPAFGILKKITEQQKEIIKTQMVAAESMDRVRALQGQIAGVNLITSVPEIIAKARELNRKADEQRAKKDPKRRRNATS
jgi:hypothetical protein